MPKLTKAMADKVEEAETGDFEPIPEGIYLAVLEGEVEAVEGQKGTYWKWVFKITQEGDGKGRKMFVNTSLSDAAHWKLKEVFQAFGVPTDTDTDDLIGQEVKLMVIQKLAEQGKRKGDMVNEVEQVLPANQATTAPGAAKTKNAAKADEPALF